MSSATALDPITKYIPLDDLVVADERVEVDPQAMDGLIQSIGAVGLLQPIVVVKTQRKRHGEDTLVDRYHVVAGRRRIRAVRTLGWNAIPATILELGDVSIKMAMISENLHRQELALSERDEAMREFTELYKIQHPDWEKQIERRRDAVMRRARGILPPTPADSSSPPSDAGAVNPFVAASKAFGVDRKVVKEAVLRTHVLNQQQRKILEVAGVSIAKMNRLVELDPETIAAIVNLVAAGFSFEESVRDTHALAADLVETQETVDDLLAQLPARRSILDPEAFDMDVSAWQTIQPHVDQFKKQIGWSMLKATAGKGPHGLCYRRWLLALEMLHPRSWTACRCQLSGNRDPRLIQNCPICRGGGYQIGS